MKLFSIRGGLPASGFEELLRPHVPWLYRLAIRFCQNPDDAQDLVQDLLVKLVPRTSEVARLDKPRPWLARALYHQYVDLVRRRSRSPLGLADMPAEGEESDPLASLPSDELGPEDWLDCELDAERLTEALATLPPEQRSLLVLHDVEDYTLQEIADMIETPLGTLKSRLHRARARLRGLLAGMEPSATVRRVSH